MSKAININLIFIFTVIFGVCVLVYYILQVGALSQDIYLLDDYERRLAALFDNNSNLDIDFSKMNSLSRVEGYLASRDFIKPVRVDYIRLLESSVAAK